MTLRIRANGARTGPTRTWTRWPARSCRTGRSTLHCQAPEACGQWPPTACCRGALSAWRMRAEPRTTPAPKEPGGAPPRNRRHHQPRCCWAGGRSSSPPMTSRARNQGLGSSRIAEISLAW